MMLAEVEEMCADVEAELAKAEMYQLHCTLLERRDALRRDVLRRIITKNASVRQQPGCAPAASQVSAGAETQQELGARLEKLERNLDGVLAWQDKANAQLSTAGMADTYNFLGRQVPAEQR